MRAGPAEGRRHVIKASAALLLLVGVLGGASAEESREPAAWHPSVQPVAVGKDPSTWPAGDWVPIRAGLLKAPPAASDLFLSELTLRGELVGDTLTGEGELTIEAASDGEAVLRLGDSNLAIWNLRRARLQAADDPVDDPIGSDEATANQTSDQPQATTARIGRDGTGELALLLPRSASRQLAIDWAADGLPLFRERRFRLVLPTALTTTIELTLPSDLEVRSEEAIITSRATRQTDSEQSVWTLSTLRQPAVELTIRPRSKTAPMQARVRSGVLARVTEAGLSWRADLTIERPGTTGDGSSKIEIELPERVTVDTLEVAGIPQPINVLPLDGRISVPVTIATNPAIVRIGGERSFGSNRRQIPQPVVRDARLDAADVSIECDPRVVIKRTEQTQLRQVSASLRSGRGDRMQFTAIGSRPKLTLIVGPPRAELAARTLSVVEFAPLRTRLTSLVSVNSTTGSTSRVRMSLPTGWSWIACETVAGPTVLGWDVTEDDAGTLADVELTSPVSARSELILSLMAVRSGDAEPLDVPFTLPRGADVESATLILEGADVDGLAVVSGGSAVAPSSPELLAADPLSNRLDDSIIGAASDRLQVYELDATATSRISRTRSAAASPDRPPVVADDLGPAVAKLSLRSRLGDWGDAVHFHEATIDLFGQARRQPPRLQLPGFATLVDADLDGRPLRLQADDENWLTPSETGPSSRDARQLRLRYTTPALDAWLVQNAEIAVPRLAIPTVDFRWQIVRPDSTHVSVAPAPVAVAGEKSVALSSRGLDRLSWKTRLFGPLGRRSGELIATYGSLQASRPSAETPEAAIQLRAVQPAAAYRLTISNRPLAINLGWLGLVGSLLVGLSIRRWRLLGRARAAAYWAPTAFALGWFGPDYLAACFGGAAVGTVLSMMLPRRLILPHKPAPPADYEDGSTSIVEVPSKLRIAEIGTASAIAILGLTLATETLAQQGTGPAGSALSAVADTGKAVVLIPGSGSDPDARVPDDAIVYLQRKSAAKWLRRASDRDVIFTSARLRVETADRRERVRLRYAVECGPDCRGVRLPLSNGLSVRGEALVDGQPVSPIPSFSGDVVVPVAAAESWTSRTIELVLQLPPADSSGVASLAVPPVMDTVVEQSPYGVLPVPLDVAADGASRLPPTQTLFVQTAVPDLPALVAAADYAVLIDELTTSVLLRVSVENCEPGTLVEMVLPPAMPVDAVDMLLPTEDGESFDRSRLPIPIERRADGTRLVLPPETSTRRTLLLSLSLAATGRSKSRELPIPALVVDGRRQAAVSRGRVLVSPPSGYGVTIEPTPGVQTSPLTAESNAELLRSVPGLADLLPRPGGGFAFASEGPLPTRRLRLLLEPRPSGTSAAIEESLRFGNDAIEWSARVEMQVAGGVWQRSIDIDRRLSIDTLSILQDGLQALDRWSRNPSPRPSMDRVTLLFEEPQDGLQTLSISGRIPYGSRRGGAILPRFEVRAADVVSRQTTIENAGSQSIELLDESRQPWTGAAMGTPPQPASAMPLSAGPVSFSDEASLTPWYFRVRGASSKPALETAAVIDAADRLSVAAAIRPDSPSVIQGEFAIPGTGELRTTLVELDSRPQSDARLVRLVSNEPVAIATVMSSDVAWQGPPIDSEDAAALPAIAMENVPASRHFLAVPAEATYEAGDGGLIDWDSVPEWLQVRLGSGERWTVYQSAEPIRLVREGVRIAAPWPQITHDVWPGAIASGRTTLSWAEPSRAAIAADRIEIVAAFDGDVPIAIGEPQPVFAVSSAASLDLWWVATESGAATVPPHPDVTTDAVNERVARLVLHVGPSDRVTLTREGGASRTLDLSGETATTLLAGTAATGPLAVDVARPLPPGSGFVLSLLMLTAVITVLVPRSTLARRAPEEFAKRPYVMACCIGLLWWLFLSPSVLGPILIAAAAIHRGVLRFRDDRAISLRTS